MERPEVVVNRRWAVAALLLASGVAHAQPNSWSVALVGDVMMGTTYPSPRLPTKDGAGLFSPALPSLASADLTFGNLEGPLAEGGVSTKQGCSNCYAFRTPPRYAMWLRQAGFDGLSVANNHARDFGEEGQRQTIRALQGQGIAWAGTLSQPWVLLTDSQGRRCAFLAFSTGPSSPRVQDLQKASALVKEASRHAQLVVVSFHAGAEGTGAGTTPKGTETFHGENRGDVRRFAQTVVKAGADIVFGHGPHVPRGLELIDGRLVLYSLGNFRTYGPFSKAGAMAYSPLVTVNVGAQGEFLDAQIESYLQQGDHFSTDPHHSAARWMWQKTQEDFGPGLTIGAEGQVRRTP